MKEISVVIPYKFEPRSSELRFALRSIEKHLTGYGKVWVMGDLPPWIQGVEHIACGDSTDPRRHEENIYRKLMLACGDGRISEQFLMLHDDHLLLREYAAADFPYYTHRSLLAGQQANQGAYRTTLIRTEKLLRSMCLDTKDFDCHCPIVYDKAKFTECFDGIAWREYGVAIKSVYCNYWEIEGKKCDDLKLIGRKLAEMTDRVKGRGWFSTGNSNPPMELFLAGLFPLKSKYER